MTDPIDSPFLQPLEPTAQQQGLDVPGFYSATTDFINFGVYNGNFRVGPPQAASNLDVASSVTGSNFLPGWRFVQSSNTTITAAIIQSGGVQSGSNVRFTAAAGVATGHASFLEQVIDIGGSAVGDNGNLLRVTAANNGSMNGLQIDLAAQYLAANGSLVGMPAERVQQASIGSTTPASVDVAADVNPPPANARYLRVRAIVKSASGGGTVAGDWLDIYDVRRDRALVNLRMPDISRSTNGLYDIRMSGSNLIWQPSKVTAGGGASLGERRLLNYQLVAIPFSLVNIPANATTGLQMWGDTALALGTPRIGTPWPGAIVGMSYRLSAIPTAGGATALRVQATVAGVNVWDAFTIPGTGGTLTGENTIAPTVDEFNNGQQLGVQVVTSATYAPTTSEIAVLLWVALKYDGS